MSQNFVGDVVVGRWRVGEFIGSGATGSVHYVSDLQRRRMNLVIKFGVPHQVRPPNSDMAYVRQGMWNERIALLALNNGDPSLKVPKVVESGTHDGVWFIIMTRFGPSIGQRWETENRHFPNSTILKITYQVLSILKRIHASGVSHGDIEESNILEAGEGQDPNYLYLIDFGASSQLTPINQMADIADTLDLMFRMFSYNQVTLDSGEEYISIFNWLHSPHRIKEQVRRNLSRVESIRRRTSSSIPADVRNFVEEFLAPGPPDFDRMLRHLQRSIQEEQNRSE